ncbi:hypothetical protein K523DRAFT_422205 [Schizophyllum commune Tattone D]|nr:hypothetical protein K523DRAFT_422205 [Schizophyllum commune Tattone D]
MDYTLYSRQLILPGFGLPAQQALLRAKVAVVGAGGLGCPALTYLALSGVGHITVIDHDTVDLSNLARQSLHSRASIGTNKALSAQASLAALAPNIAVTPIPAALDPTNALSLLANHDLILDCTDNPATRYLLNDAAVALHTPLVSAAAQQYDGQLAVYNYRGGPCLRCVFPKPPAPQFAPSCSEVGVLGPVVATIGSLQALEAIKILANLAPSPPPPPHMLLFSALATPPFRSIKLRNRKPDCIACSNPDAPIDVASTDYVQLCGGPRPDWESLGMEVRDPALRIDAKTLSTRLTSDPPPLLIDVRPPVEFGICRIEGSINIPLPTLLADPRKVLEMALGGSLAQGGASTSSAFMDAPTSSASTDTPTSSSTDAPTSSASTDTPTSSANPSDDAPTTSSIAQSSAAPSETTPPTTNVLNGTTSAAPSETTPPTINVLNGTTNEGPTANGGPTANDAPTANGGPTANDGPTTNGGPTTTSSTPSSTPTPPRPLITLCRLGNDSQLAADALRDA